MNTRSTDEVQQKRLYLIVSMVSHTERARTTLGRHFREPFVAQLTSRHFYADTMALGKAARTKMLYMQYDSASLTQTTAESFIAVAGNAAKFKITMQSLHRIAQFLQRQQEGNAVGSTAESNQQHIPVFRDGGGCQSLLYRGQKRSHCTSFI